MWQPELPSGTAPIYARLADAMERDIRAGTLAVGTRLPPQRDLAYALNISVGSVTKAYAEATRRGFLRAHVGRGSYVHGLGKPTRDAPVFEREDAAAQGGVIDLRCNTPPHVPLSARLGETISHLAARQALEPAVQYVDGAGPAFAREAGARWISRRHGLPVSATGIVQCNGGQHAIALVFSSFCRPGDTILCESSTFYGARVAADHLGLGLRGVAMDADGMVPDALARLAAETRARLLFTIPTLHNPTTRSMSAARRAEIAEVARRFDLTILEDDAYYAYTDPAMRPPQLATYAPERTIYLASISKGVCPGLRLAFLALPVGMTQDRLLRGIRAFGYCPPALGAMAFAAWVEDGTADAIADAVQAETAARFALARDALGAAMVMPGAARAPHVWLPMSALDAERITMRALRAGVELTPPDVFAVSEHSDTGLRVCLGATRDRASLGRALGIVADALATKGFSGESII